MPTTGTPLTLTFPVAIIDATGNSVPQKVLVHITATDQSGNTVVPTGLTVAADNANVTTATGPDAVSFYILSNPTTPGTANVTFTDAGGDTLLVAVTTTPATTPTPVTVTLSATFDPPIAQ